MFCAFASAANLGNILDKAFPIAAAYLKNFLDPSLGNLLHAYNKENLEHFTPTTKNICCAQDWDTNPYFEDDRAIDQYLQVVEPKWNDGVKDIRNLLRYEEVKYFMAGYIAVLASCTPAAIRTLTHSTAEIIASSGNIIAQQMQDHPERFPGLDPLPDDIFQKIMDAGGMKAEVDPKHTHARAAENLVNTQWVFYKSEWKILDNQTDSPFLTSDFPVAFYYPKPQSQIPFRYIPISPRYAVMIAPSLDEEDKKHPKEEFDEFPETKTEIVSVKPRFPEILNKLTVQGAEKFVISAHDKPWIGKLVKRYKNWKMDSGTVRFPIGNGEIIVSKQMPSDQAA